jgi:hypothetical protein
MTSPRKPAKQSSGWGGFLQQAVLSVESRLDNILADEDQSSAKTTTANRQPENGGQGTKLPSINDYGTRLICVPSCLNERFEKFIRCQDQ